MTNFNRSGFNPLRPNPNAPQQNRPIDSPAQEPQSSSRPAGHPEAGPSDTRQEARPQNYPSAADVAIHQRARFDQQRGDAVARADAPEASTRQNFLLKAGGQSSTQGGIQNAAAAAPADSGEQELANIFSSLPDLIPNMPEPAFSSQPRNVPSGSGNQHGKRPASEPQTEPRLVRRRTDGNPPPQVPAPFAPSHPEPATWRGAEQRGVQHAAASAHHERACFFQQRGNVAARADAPEEPIKKKSHSKSLLKILKGLEPYKEGKTLKECVDVADLPYFSSLFSGEGKLRKEGKKIYDGLEPADQEKFTTAMEMRKAALAGGSTRKPPRHDVQKILKGLESYKEGKNMLDCEVSSRLFSFAGYFLAKGGLTQKGDDLYEQMDPSIQAQIREAIKIRKAVLAGRQSSKQGNVPSGSGNQHGKRPASEPQTESRLVLYRTDGVVARAEEEIFGSRANEPQTESRLVLYRTDGVVARAEGEIFGSGANNVNEGFSASQFSIFDFPPTPSDGWQMPETPQGGRDRSRVPPSDLAHEIVDVDNYPSPPAATVGVAQSGDANRWLGDNDFVNYTQMLAELLRGQPRAEQLHFVDPLEVQLLLNGDEAQRNAARHRLTDPNTPPILFLPVNNNNIHWSLLVANRETGQAFHYDSMASPFPSQISVAGQVADALGVREPIETPMAKQTDTYSCGDHVLTGIEVLAHRVVRGEAFQDGGMNLSTIQPNRVHIINILTRVEQFGR